MELRDFITETLVEIIEGISNAQSKLEDKGNLINPDIWNDFNTQKTGKLLDPRISPIEEVRFDIAVNVTDTEGVNAKIGVLSGIIGASMQGKGEKSNESINRISFSVPIAFPKV